MFSANTREVMVESGKDSDLSALGEKALSIFIQEVPGKGKGVIALRHFRPGEPVLVAKPACILAERTKYSLQVGPNKHILLAGLGPYINSSCTPNTRILTNAYGGYTYIALRPIKVCEEITCDYSSFEDKACLH